ncbi:MAG: MXAN_5187 C-terminal domain-containing protein [Candidatus Acidiferrales bacterium]
MATSAEEDLAQLEKDIRQLKIEYEQFFGGGRKRPPADTQWRVETIIKRYGDRGSEMNNAQRFRYTNIAQTFAKYCEIWRKKLKEREEGVTQRHFGAAARAIEAERAKSEQHSAPPKETSPRLLTEEYSMALRDPEREKERVEQLYRKLVEARASTGETGGTPSFEDFGKFVREKTRELKTQKGAGEVEYTVSVEGGRVKLKARLSK